MTQSGPIAWMAKHSVASNLIMLIMLLGGVLFASTMKQEVFPEFETDAVQVSVSYQGASPDEIESSIVLPIEDALNNIDGIKKVQSLSLEGQAVVTAEVHLGEDTDKISRDIKNEIDRITQFPIEAEEPVVIVPSMPKRGVLIALYGNTSPQTLHKLGEQFRLSLLEQKAITQVDITGLPELEIQVEIDRDLLRQYSLSIPKIADTIRQYSVDMPNGSIRTHAGEIMLRMQEKRADIDSLSTLPIVSSKEGAIVRLGDIARFKDSFAETGTHAKYNDLPAVMLDVFLVGKATPLEISNAVKAASMEADVWLPEGIDTAILSDASTSYSDRVSLLISNGLTGLLLVLIVLAIFLEIRLAFWVMMGIPIAFLGAFLILPALGMSLNMISLFAFIISLGIVVDDAIIVGENVYHHRQNGLSPIEASIRGTREIAAPITFSVLTSVATFLPLYFMPGMMGKIFQVIPVVVIACFMMSLFEGLFILPAHLADIGSSIKQGPLAYVSRLQQRFSHGFKWWVNTYYRGALILVTNHRYLTVLSAVSILVVTLAFVASGRLGIEVFPKSESDFAKATITLPVGSHADKVSDIAHFVALQAEKASGAHKDALIKGILVDLKGDHIAVVTAYLAEEDDRANLLSTGDFVKAWRALADNAPGVDSMLFQADSGGPGSGRGLAIELSHRDLSVLQLASKELSTLLKDYPVVSDIDDGFKPGKQQFDFTLTDKGVVLGFTPSNVSSQVRSSFYGGEVDREQRGRNEVKIMVRLSDNERLTQADLTSLLLQAPNGKMVPLLEVVSIKKGFAFNKINRSDGRRTVEVSASVTPQNKSNEVISDVKETLLPELVKKYPGLTFSFEGSNADMVESLSSLLINFPLALFVVYALLAIPFRSYIMPFVVISSIPFGIIGAIFGHLIMGIGLSIVSMLGIVALSGIVVNAALVLINSAKINTDKGMAPKEAIIDAAIGRFRPIILTTLTTFFGLMPITFETSTQAAMLIPMAVSLSYGVLFSTLITLVLIPALYLIVHDVKGVTK